VKAGQRVAIVIPCYQHAYLLAAAIESALKQSLEAAEVVVVDDGSTDRPGEVVRRYPSVRLIEQENRGLASARNAGLRAVESDKVIFLDADDRLLGNAIEAGLSAFADRPEAAFVYGPYREIRALRRARRVREASAREDLVRCNAVGMIASVMFDRAKLLEIGGFDESLGMCEDWDVYLRLTRKHPFAIHGETVAEYVRHRGNMSNDTDRLLHWVGIVRDKERERGLSPTEQIAWEEGTRFFKDAYTSPLKRVLRRLMPWRGQSR
jgi:glycosyltransferase involved in cell wall biosynthesis